MADLSVIVRRVLRHRIKSDEGLDQVVGELIGDDWQAMMSSSRTCREGIVEQIVQQIRTRLQNSSFMESSFRNGDTSIDLNRQTVTS